MLRKALRTISSLIAILSGLLWSIAADAQNPFLPPPIRPSIDENGVDLVSGQLQLTRPDIVIGQPGAGGLSFGAIGTIATFGGIHNLIDPSWYSGAITIVTGSPNATYTVSLAGQAETFTKANSPSTSPFVSVQGRGSTLTQTSANYTYTSPDGTVAVFSKSITYVQRATAAAHVVQMTLPEGEIRTYHYVSAMGCDSVLCVTTTGIRRLQAVTNNRGYQIKLISPDSRVNTAIPALEVGDWHKFSSAIGINMAVDYCDPAANACTGLTQSPPTVSYSPVYPYPVSVVTNQLGGTTTYSQEIGGSPLSIRWPGSQSDDVVYTFSPNDVPMMKVASVNRHGRTWNYSYSSTATDLTTVVTDPQIRQSTYVFDAATRSVKSYTNTAGELTTYQNDSKGRPSIVTLPTLETIRYQYDARGNVTEVRRTSYPAGSPDLVSAAGYDMGCITSTAKRCNKPNWTRDPAGNQTDYVYSNTHGNVTKVTLPAQPNGIRPVTDFVYAPFQAYYKNSAGAITAGTNIYYLTRVAECRTTATCSDTSADRLRTDIGYGANNVANNRLPVTSTVRNGSATLSAITSIEYDAVGNAVAVDGPLSGTVDRTATRYDALRRVIGSVGPDPDATGPRTHIGVRTQYNSRGLPATVDTGTLPGQTDSAWTSFVPSQSLVREFDADRRVTKTSLVAGGSTYAVEQASFDNLGRLDCSVTRMNPAYFGALPSACNATSEGPFGPDRILKHAYDNADRVTGVISGFGHPNAIVEQALDYSGGRLACGFRPCRSSVPVQAGPRFRSCRAGVTRWRDYRREARCRQRDFAFEEALAGAEPRRLRIDSPLSTSR